MDLRAIELFAGGGGLALGLHAVGVESVCLVERDFFAASVLAKALEEGRLPPAVVHSDVLAFDGRPWRGAVQVVSGGFPCQDISCAGKGAGLAGARSGLWSEFRRVVSEVQPRLVFVENVGPLAVRGLDTVLSDLAALGLDAEWGAFRASDVGAPHRRERLFILAGVAGSTAPDAGLADAERESLRLVAERDQREGWGERAPVGGDAEPRHARLETLDDADRPVADADAGRPQGIGQPERARLDGERGHVAVGRDQDRRLPWPPCPGDERGWREYLRRFPAAEPGVRRSADGMAHRVDRLRVLGNGVVPQQAALAWRVLYRRLTGETWSSE